MMNYKNFLFSLLFGMLILSVSPAWAVRHAACLSCKGPAQIVLGNHTFTRYDSSSSCLSKYASREAASAQSDDAWGPYVTLSSRLIKQPAKTVEDTLRNYATVNNLLQDMVSTSDINFTPRLINRSNPNDIVATYRIIQSLGTYDIMNYVTVRALRQSDGTVRIYYLVFTMQALGKPLSGKYNTQTKGTYEYSYDRFNQLVKKHYRTWITGLFQLDATCED